MADHEWLQQYTPVDDQSTSSTSEPDTSWLSQFTPVESKPAPKIGALEAGIRGAGDGITLGFQDEILAGLDAAVQPLIPIPENGSEASTFRERYDENVANQRAMLKAGQDQQPVASLAGGIAGGIAPAMASGGGSIAATAGAVAKQSLAKTAAKSAAVGAGYGGAYGLGTAEGDLQDRLPGAGGSALLGAGVGAAAPLAIAGVSAAARRATPQRLLPADSAKFTEEAQQGVPPESPIRSALVSAEAELPTAGRSVVDAVRAPARNQDIAYENLIDAIQPQREVIGAASRLGIDGLTPGQLSGNQSIRNIEGALAALPNNDLAKQRFAPLDQLTQRADDFISQFGGNRDKAAFSDDFKRNANATITGLGTQADDLYRYIGQQIPRTTQAPADNTVAYLRSKSAELGGKPLLNAEESKALAVLSPTSRTVSAGALYPGQVRTEITHPTYAALDLVRKQIGQGYRNSGPFKDMESGTRDALYSALTRDQEALVNSVSPDLGGVYQGAKALVAQRKSLEEGLQSVLGKDLSASIATSFGSSVKQLAKGNFKNFDNIIQHIPEKDRQSAIVTAMGDAFSNASSKMDLSASGFVRWYGELGRNNSARARLTKYLPQDAVQRLDDIFTLSKAISDAASASKQTGISIGVLKDIADEGGVVARIMEIAKPALAAEGVGMAAGIPGLGAGAAIVTAMRRNQEPIQDRAAKLLASPKLREMLSSYVASGGQLKANVLAREKQLVRTQAYRSWERALSESSRARVATVGPLVYLTERPPASDR